MQGKTRIGQNAPGLLWEPWRGAASDSGLLLHTHPNSSSRLPGHLRGGPELGCQAHGDLQPAALNPRRPARAEIGQAGLEEGRGAEGRARCWVSSGFPRSHILFSQPGESVRAPLCSRGPPSPPPVGGKESAALTAPASESASHEITRPLAGEAGTPSRSGRPSVTGSVGARLFDADEGRKAGAGVTTGQREVGGAGASKGDPSPQSEGGSRWPPNPACPPTHTYTGGGGRSSPERRG